MARIRSIHPGQWTDEAFVSVSFPARLLAIGLRNLADDRGAFEWKPLVIKMQLFPADHVSVDDLFAELVQADIVCAYTASGKSYGAIRNFLKWQRPQRPSYVHDFPETLADYVGQSWNEAHELEGNSRNAPRVSESVPRKSPQRKEEGGRRKEVSTSAIADVSPPMAETPLPLLPDDSPPPASPAPKAASRKPSLPLAEAVEIWNEVCGPSLSRVVKLTPNRERPLRARLAELGPDPLPAWRAYCERIAASDILTGRTQRTGPYAGWRADFEWALRPDTPVRVAEGRYDNDRNRPAPLAPGQRREAPGTI